MPNKALLPPLLGDIYEAAYDPAHWPAVIEKISRFTDSRSGALFIRDTSAADNNSFYPYGLTTEALADYARFGHLDPAFGIMAAEPIGQARAILGPARHRAESDEYYEHVRIRHDIGHLAGAVVLADEQLTVGLGLHRGAEASAYDDETLHVVTEIIPHLQRALRFQREFIQLRAERHALCAGVDRLTIGIALLNRHGTPVYLNPVASAILATHPAIRLVDNKILPTVLADAQALQRLVMACLARPLGREHASGGVLAIRHAAGPHPLAVMVKPIAGNEFDNLIHDVPIYAAIYLNDPELPPPITATTLAKLFQLSPTESQIAIALANGLGVDEIAQLHSRSINTVRTHLRALFQKTRTANQTDLLRLLLSITAA